MTKRITIMGLLLIAFAVVLYVQHIDLAFLNFITTNRVNLFNPFFKFVTHTAKIIAILIPIILLGIGIKSHSKELIISGIVIIGALALTTVLVLALKYGINRPRPFIVHPNIKPLADKSSPSFPSGHTAIAFVIATALSLNYRRWYIVVFSFLWGVLVGFSRLYLGLHYFSDVLMSAGIGVIIAVVTYKLKNWVLIKYHLK